MQRRQNYTMVPSVIDVTIESVSINGVTASVDHLSGTIPVGWFARNADLVMHLLIPLP